MLYAGFVEHCNYNTETLASRKSIRWWRKGRQPFRTVYGAALSKHQLFTTQSGGSSDIKPKFAAHGTKY